jgi:hypothetical protein
MIGGNSVLYKGNRYSRNSVAKIDYTIVHSNIVGEKNTGKILKGFLAARYACPDISPKNGKKKNLSPAYVF